MDNVIIGLNNHDYYLSLHGQHTSDFKSGYADGYQAGWDDIGKGINKKPC